MLNHVPLYVLTTCILICVFESASMLNHVPLYVLTTCILICVLESASMLNHVPLYVLTTCILICVFMCPCTDVAGDERGQEKEISAQSHCLLART